MTSQVAKLKRQQVADQCKVVAHLANAIAKVHLDYEKIIRTEAFDSLLDQVGERSAALMDDLGDILNEMDACSPDDEWTNPIFEARSGFGWGVQNENDIPEPPSPASSNSRVGEGE